MKRKSWSRVARIRIWDRHRGICVLCDNPIDTHYHKPWTLEHIKPLWLGGADDETNLAPAHYDCAIEKTCGEAPVKAKTDRQRAKHLGIKKRRSIKGWKRFDGTPVYAGRDR